MPTMYEVYEKYAVNYDELVNAEDYMDNLGDYLRNNVDWKDSIVYEAAIGTGRLTAYYIDKVKHVYGFDSSEHMLQKCRNNLNKYEDKLSLSKEDNLNLKPAESSADIFIEGWSFGHMLDYDGLNIQKILADMAEIITNVIRADGEALIVESLGTNVEAPTLFDEEYAEFFNSLESTYKFRKEILRTDYRFNTPEEASRVMGFFFGDEMAKDILAQQKIIIKEYTGVWHLNRKS